MGQDGAGEGFNLAEGHGFPAEGLPGDGCGFDAGADGQKVHVATCSRKYRSHATAACTRLLTPIFLRAAQK